MCNCHIGLYARFNDVQTARLQALAVRYGCNLDVVRDIHNDAAIAGYDVILGNPPTQLLPRAGRLKLLHLMSAGVNGYTNIDCYVNKQIILVNASGAYGLAISEWMLGMHLMLIKRLHIYRDHMRDGVWQRAGQVTSIHGSTVICVGLGDIGGSYAALAKALGAYVIGVRRTDGDTLPYVDEAYTVDRLPDVIGRGDCIAVSLPATDRTAGLISRDLIDRMKPDAILLNVGRGSVIDTDALCDALRDGRIGGAGLDVTHPEPLPPDHELWRLPNVIITPHVSGGDSLPATHDSIVDIMCRNVEDFLNGRPIAKTVSMREQY